MVGATRRSPTCATANREGKLFVFGVVAEGCGPLSLQPPRVDAVSDPELAFRLPTSGGAEWRPIPFPPLSSPMLWHHAAVLVHDQ